LSVLSRNLTTSLRRNAYLSGVSFINPSERSVMKKLIIASALAAAFATPALAQTAAPAAEAAPASPHTLTANVGLFSSYRFRGIAIPSVSRTF
jgi:hypothetical protein